MITTRELLGYCKVIVVFADDPWPYDAPLPVIAAARNVVSGKPSQSDLDLVEAYMVMLMERPTSD